MKLNLEKNFKSLFKKKVSFTMVALTIFAITGGVSLADDGKLNENLATGSDAITAINETNKRVNKHGEDIVRMQGAIDDKADKTELAKKANKTEFEKERQRSQTADEKHDERLDKVEDTVETHGMAIKGLKNNKADKEETEKALKELTTGLSEEAKDRKANEKKLNKAIDKNKEAISEQGEMITELDKQLSTTNSKLGTLSRDFDAAKKDIETNKENIEKEKSLRETADDMLYGDITDNREAINKESEKREALEKALETEILRSIDADVEHEFAMKEAAKEREYLGEVLDKTVSKVGKLELDKADKTDVEKVKSDLSAAKEDMENKLGTAYDQIDANDTARREADERHENAIKAHEAAIESNRAAINHLDKKVNKGTAMLVAMSNVDFQDVNAGEVAVGAGVGHYVGDQAVAVGVAYGVNDDFKVHAKFSGVAGDPHYNAIGGGLTYKFRTR